MTMRCFIAFEVPEDLQEALGRVQAKLFGAGADVKWSKPETIHLTVKFLGDVTDRDIPAACDAMKAAAAEAEPMDLSIEGLGAFPAEGAPRVLWAGLSGDIEPLKRLVADLEKAVADDVGIRPEVRPFHPHLTLGRVRSERNAERLMEAVRAAGPAEIGSFSADELVLFMSELTRKGPIYTPMARARLGD
jgi:2'-5' RNA ligase